MRSEGKKNERMCWSPLLRNDGLEWLWDIAAEINRQLLILLAKSGSEGANG